ncbi:hypothetical protein SAMN02799624_05530 [Paenibacillus sp. UNC496MF]|uniref:hypothetical protein n=1 Tax=Paenibacillus sp. UNC496MF TaxID=1502753 RepID=UPI0008E04EB1|nr:hypothetical protein [Paenibacillus sp. UNC496MF]SFJ69364.1 hypothetical protein SAMN02799624_05530 [Paenibacillus sp. UNC496MF]
MKRTRRVLAIVRRTLLVFLALVLLPYYIERWTQERGRGINDPMEAVHADGTYMRIPVGRPMAIDEDTFTVDEVYVDDEHILVTYTYRSTITRNSWSLPTTAFKLRLPDGQLLENHESGSSGFPGGQRGYLWYDAPKTPATRATLFYELYDRKAELDIPLAEGGAEA